MSQNPDEILKYHWGYDSFRGIQEQVIRQIMEGRDTLALMPTGGGKSLCFQVPSLAMSGICVVVSPLIALMNDQVDRLRSMNIHAYAITSEMHRKEIEVLLGNCIHDSRVKFLYVSPERLKTELFTAAFKQMKVCLIAVDEAHCISQWGYDFRPPYLEIAEIRKHHPKVPVLALTATATEGVAKDICLKLHFAEENIVKMSFERKNLAYIVMQTEEKLKTMVDLLVKIQGPAIVYAGTRRQVKELADAFNKRKLTAVFYHAGLSVKEKKKAEADWKSGSRRIMVATNAFGMGIDKADVRLVLHADVPGDPEAYFQEAGRAGRDGKHAYAVLLWEKKDIADMKRRIELKYPAIEFVRNVYSALCVQVQVPFNEGVGMSFPLRLAQLCEHRLWTISMVYPALKLLENSGYLIISDELGTSARLRIVCDQRQLYDFRLRYPDYEPLIQHLMRNYDGIHELYAHLDENKAVVMLRIDREKLKNMLGFMHQNRIVDFMPATNEPQFRLTQNRPNGDAILLPPSVFRDRKKADLLRSEVMAAYLQKKTCRSVELLAYFGEKKAKPCGICDHCRAMTRKELTSEQIEKLSSELDAMIIASPLHSDALLHSIGIRKRQKAAEIIRWKLDTGAWETDNKGILKSKQA